MGVNIGLVLRQSALRRPEAVAVIDTASEGRTIWRYDELDRAARRAAAVLAAKGAGPGARVALLAANSADFVQAWFGIVYVGASVVPIPILSAPPEIAFRLKSARCEFVIADSARRTIAEQAESRPVVDLEAVVGSAVPPIERPVQCEPGDPAMILYTSGTTGKPRGALLSHAALLTHTATLVQHTLALCPEDRILGVLPLTHSFGCRMVMLAGFYAGARVVLVPRFDAAATRALMTQEALTWVPAVPTMYSAWAALPGSEPPPVLRWCLSAGAPLSDDVALRAEAALGAEVRGGYGMTEATFSTVNSPPDARVLGSVGKPVWGVEVRVVDEGGDDLPAGADGQILVRGPNLMTAYLDDPEATAEALRGGWMHSRDVGRLDEAGRLTVVDRLSDLILRGGNNVYPSEVEDALAAHPDVAEVVVVGRPDPYYGEEVVAVVVPRAGTHPQPEGLIAWAKERVSRTKYPREVVLVDALPLGPSGKVVRREIRDRLLAGDLTL